MPDSLRGNTRLRPRDLPRILKLSLCQPFLFLSQRPVHTTPPINFFGPVNTDHTGPSWVLAETILRLTIDVCGFVLLLSPCFLFTTSFSIASSQSSIVSPGNQHTVSLRTICLQSFQTRLDCTSETSFPCAGKTTIRKTRPRA